MARLSVVPSELQAAAAAVRGARGDLAGLGGGLDSGGVGSGALEAALADAAARIARVAEAMDVAVSAAGSSLDAAGEAYAVTDQNAMPGGQV